MESALEGSMRVPARSVAALAALAAVWLCAGCATRPSIAVAYDEHEDLSQFRTWDWIEGRALLVYAPSYDAAQLESSLAAFVERELRERGLERARGSGELRVAALLVVRHTYQTFRRARAMQTLHTYHDSGSYEVQAEELERRPLDRIRLAVYVTGPQQERLLWQGELDDQFIGGFAPHLDDAVANLLADFPPAPRAAASGAHESIAD